MKNTLPPRSRRHRISWSLPRKATLLLSLLTIGASFTTLPPLHATPNPQDEPPQSPVTERKNPDGTISSPGLTKPFPEHWGDPPEIQTRDIGPLPAGFGQGSSTLKHWIEEKLAEDKARGAQPANGDGRPADGDGAVSISGELRQWHKVTLTLEGPYAHEDDEDPNPFTDYALTVRFVHESGTPDYLVPGYFAADGQAAETSAQAGTRWRAHLSPDKPGEWRYETSLTSGTGVALQSPGAGKPLTAFSQEGTFHIQPTDKEGRDFRAQGRLTYVGQRYLQFAGSQTYFLKVGADAPETFLAYEDFDATEARNPRKAPLKTWEPHLQDWRPGDPTWQEGKGKGMIGALNYLSEKGANAFSFLTYNAGGDGDNVWPFNQYERKLHYDCSKLDQWAIVFDHATTRGLYCHFKLQETENDDLFARHGVPADATIPAALDGGDLGPERKLYLREMIARFAHLLALNWNLGEENTQSTEQQTAMLQALRELDPYDHHRVVHTYPDEQKKVYQPFLGKPELLTGVSLQNSDVADCHSQVVHWVGASTEAGLPWVVAFDEPGTAHFGMPPDPGYPGTPENFSTPSIHQTRQQALWGTLLGGGTGVEYYFGYRLPENDLLCQDWRSRDRSWDYGRFALNFFADHEIPFWEMENADALAGNAQHDNSVYVFAKPDHLYLIYLPQGGTTELDLTSATKSFRVLWYNPRTGGELISADPTQIKGGKTVSLGPPPTEAGQDWLLLLRP